jgi:CRISPR-associated exonuclease Cas4
VHTVEGTHAHKRADDQAEHSASHGVRTARGVLLRCQRLRLTGKADIVEFHLASNGAEMPFPVEYKRGKRRRWDNNEVQLCAQALCLEEMLGTSVPAGAIFHVKSKRRREIEFSAKLRAETETAAVRLHELFASGITPPPVLKPRCQGCSLHDLCMPELYSRPVAISRYDRMLWSADPDG